MKSGRKPTFLTFPCGMSQLENRTLDLLTNYNFVSEPLTLTSPLPTPPPPGVGSRWNWLHAVSTLIHHQLYLTSLLLVVPCFLFIGCYCCCCCSHSATPVYSCTQNGLRSSMCTGSSVFSKCRMCGFPLPRFLTSCPSRHSAPCNSLTLRSTSSWEKEFRLFKSRDSKSEFWGKSLGRENLVQAPSSWQHEDLESVTSNRMRIKPKVLNTRQRLGVNAVWFSSLNSANPLCNFGTGTAYFSKTRKDITPWTQWTNARSVCSDFGRRKQTQSDNTIRRSSTISGGASTQRPWWRAPP